jgi:protein TonB
MATDTHEHVTRQGVAPARGDISVPEETVDAAEPDLEFQTLVELLPEGPRFRGPFGTAASLLVHAVLVGGVVAVPLLVDAPLPEAAGTTVQAFLVTPLELAPPPPPPPPPAPEARPAAKVEAPQVERTDRFVAPIETPAELILEAGLDLGVEGGVVGGVEGGVPGGVVGGVIGGLPEAPPAPTLEPIRVGGRIQEPRKLKGVPPAYPEAARDARIEGVVILEALINPQGRVAEIEVLRGVPLLEEAAVDAVQQWVYMPTLMDGVPVPVLLTVTVRFDLTNRS